MSKYPSLEERAKQDGYDDTIEWLMSLYDKPRPTITIYEAPLENIEESDGWKELMQIVADYYNDVRKKSKEEILVAKTHELLWSVSPVYSALYGRDVMAPYIPRRSDMLEHNLENIFDFYEEKTDKGSWKGGDRVLRPWKRPNRDGGGFEQAKIYYGNHVAGDSEITSMIEVPLTSGYKLGFSLKTIPKRPSTINTVAFFKNRDKKIVDDFNDFYKEQNLKCQRESYPEEIPNVYHKNFAFTSFTKFNNNQPYDWDKAMGLDF